MLTVRACHCIGNRILYIAGKIVSKSCLREHATKIRHFEKKKLLTLTREELKLHHCPTNCYICGKKKFAKSKHLKV